MNSSNQTDNETICKNIFAEFRGRLTWKWDDWVGTILTEFDAEKEDDIRAVLEKFLPISWDSANINTAPQIVQKLDKHLGGIRPAQLLFSSDPSADAFVFCAWWPWGNGTTISLRIAPFSKDISQAEDDKLIGKLKVMADV